MFQQTKKIVWVGNESQTSFDSEEACRNTSEGRKWKCWKCFDGSDDDGKDGVNDIYDHISDFIHFASIICGSLGIFGNLLSIYILSKPGLGTRFSQLLIVLAYVDISYLTLCLIEVLIMTFDSFYPSRNLMNLYLILYPFLIHPGKHIFQTAQIILTVIFSLDRYIAVFYPYMVYSVEGCLSPFLRGPKRKHLILYLIAVLIASTIYCIPHFLEHTTQRKNGSIILVEHLLMDLGMGTFYYKLFYYTILDSVIRIIIPVCILAFANIKLLMLVRKETSKVRVYMPRPDISFSSVFHYPMNIA